MKVLQLYWYRCASKYIKCGGFHYSVSYSYTDGYSNSEATLVQSKINDCIGSYTDGSLHSYGEEK